MLLHHDHERAFVQTRVTRSLTCSGKGLVVRRTSSQGTHEHLTSPCLRGHAPVENPLKEINISSRGTVIDVHVVRILASHLGEPGLIPRGVAPGFSDVGIVPDNAAGLQASRSGVRVDDVISGCVPSDRRTSGERSEQQKRSLQRKALVDESVDYADKKIASVNERMDSANNEMKQNISAVEQQMEGFLQQQSATSITPAAEKSAEAVQVVTNTATSEDRKQICDIGVAQPGVGKSISIKPAPYGDQTSWRECQHQFEIQSNSLKTFPHETFSQLKCSVRRLTLPALLGRLPRGRGRMDLPWLPMGFTQAEPYDTIQSPTPVEQAAVLGWKGITVVVGSKCGHGMSERERHRIQNSSGAVVGLEAQGDVDDANKVFNNGKAVWLTGQFVFRASENVEEMNPFWQGKLGNMKRLLREPTYGYDGLIERLKPSCRRERTCLGHRSGGDREIPAPWDKQQSRDSNCREFCWVGAFFSAWQEICSGLEILNNCFDRIERSREEGSIGIRPQERESGTIEVWRPVGTIFSTPSLLLLFKNVIPPQLASINKAEPGVITRITRPSANQSSPRTRAVTHKNMLSTKTTSLVP
ncbi:hypothetical protein PR048_005337 [Dryococelus australis]|uniref:Uncharacterized protein n=1 Tax=Dryococelus australis TaxID=614101 RepID=A0ABQ9I7Z8_9NEOP|nr:hypothetical protein PR048_005337 [Dryococelus australis]